VSQRSAIDAAVAALLILLCAVWGVGQVAIKVGNEGISPLWHAAIRSGASGSSSGVGRGGAASR
jgi:hypothetical protein